MVKAIEGLFDYVEVKNPKKSEEAGVRNNSEESLTFVMARHVHVLRHIYPGMKEEYSNQKKLHLGLVEPFFCRVVESSWTPETIPQTSHFRLSSVVMTTCQELDAPNQRWNEKVDQPGYRSASASASDSEGEGEEDVVAQAAKTTVERVSTAAPASNMSSAQAARTPSMLESKPSSPQQGREKTSNAGSIQRVTASASAPEPVKRKRKKKKSSSSRVEGKKKKAAPKKEGGEKIDSEDTHGLK